MHSTHVRMILNELVFSFVYVFPGMLHVFFFYSHLVIQVGVTVVEVQIGVSVPSQSQVLIRNSCNGRGVDVDIGVKYR